MRWHFYRIKPCSLKDLEHDGDTFDHEGPLIINGAQISLVQVAKWVQIFLNLIVISNLLYLSIYLFFQYFFNSKISGPETKVFVVLLLSFFFNIFLLKSFSIVLFPTYNR